MKKILGIVMMSVLIVLFSGCGGSSGSSSTATTSSTGAGGVGAKGPFVKGSAVSAYELNSTTAARLSATASAETNTTDDVGTYSLNNLSWSGATEITIEGYYFNENNGTTSSTTASLSTIIDIITGQTVTANVNIFTDLAARRIRYLMENNSSLGLEAAREQAREDIINLFDLNISAGVSLEDLDLTDGAHNAAANAELLRVSAAVAQSPDILEGLREGIKDGNMTSTDVGAGAFVDLGNLVKDVNLTEAANNLEDHNLTTDAPDANDTDANASYVNYNETRHVPVLQVIANITVDEDTSATVELNATDEDGDSITFGATSSDANIATVSISGTTLTITPVENANGEVEIAVTASDGELADLKVFKFKLTPVNDPTVWHNSATIPGVDEDFNQSIVVELNATDVDGPVTYALVSNTGGVVDASVSGSTLTITSIANANGDANITVSATQDGVSVNHSMTLHVEPVNDAPVLEAISDINESEDSADTTITLSATDVDGDALRFSVISSDTSVVTVSVVGTTLTVHPVANANGTADVNVTASDGSLSDTKIFSVQLNPVNDLSVWHNDSVIPGVDEDFNQSIVVELNATDVDGPVTYALVSNTGGVVDASVSGSTLTITSIANANGDANITVSATQDGVSVNHSMTLHVEPVNDAPVANNDEISVVKNNQYSGNLSASDVDGDDLTYSIVQNDSNGTINLTVSSGAYTYNPATDFVGDASFTFKVTDSNGTESNTATVTIHVVDRIVNVTANDDTATIDEDTNTTIDVLANDVSVYTDDNTTAAGTTIAAVSTPANGSATIVSGGIQYVPNANYYGTDTFTYTARSASGNEDNATVTITVTSVNDVPVISTISDINEDEDGSDSNITLSATDADSNDTLTFSATSSDTSIVTVSVVGTTLTVHPVANANGTADVNVSVNDGHGGIDSTSFNVQLNPVNDTPVANDSTFDTNQNQVLTSNVTASDVDGDLNASGYVLITNVAKGDLDFYPDGNFSFNPVGYFDNLPEGVSETVWFTFTASDDIGAVSNEANVSITVTGLNDAPTVVNEIPDDTVFVGDIINENINGTFTDVDDNTTLTYTATGLPPGISFSNGNFTGSPTTLGVYNITVTASDGDLSVDDTFTVTVNYPAKASDVNNTAFIFSDDTRIVFYPDHTYAIVGMDENTSVWEEGFWDINDTVHAVQLASTDNPGQVDYLGLPHSEPSAGDILTDRYIDSNEPSDERATLLIQDVIDISGTSADLLNGNGYIHAEDVNSTTIIIADGPIVQLFANGTKIMIDNADNNISRVLSGGYWGVQNGVLGLFDENWNSEANVTFSETNIHEGTLGWHDDPNGGGYLTIRKIVDIDPNEPSSHPVNVNEISQKAVIFTDGNTIQFYEANATDAGNYWYKGRGEDGVERDRGTYQVESNGTVTMVSIAGDISVLTFNSSPAEGTLMTSYYSDDGSQDFLVIQDVFDFDNEGIYASISNTTISNKSIKLNEGSVYNFYENGTFDMSGLSYDDQSFYYEEGTWSVNGDTLSLTYLDDTVDTMKFSASTLVKGTLATWFDNGVADGSAAIQSVIDINPSHAIDTYLEYDYKAIDKNSVVHNSGITINGIQYDVIPYSQEEVTPNIMSTDVNYHIEFYGQPVYGAVASDYQPDSIVLKVFKASNGEFVGSYGPYQVGASNSTQELGNQAFSE